MALRGLDRKMVIIGICVEYRRGFAIDAACADVLDDYPDISCASALRIKRDAIKELKANSDWRY